MAKNKKKGFGGYMKKIAIAVFFSMLCFTAYTMKKEYGIISINGKKYIFGQLDENRGNLEIITHIAKKIDSKKYTTPFCEIREKSNFDFKKKPALFSDNIHRIIILKNQISICEKEYMKLQYEKSIIGIEEIDITAEEFYKVIIKKEFDLETKKSLRFEFDLETEESLRRRKVIEEHIKNSEKAKQLKKTIRLEELKQFLEHQKLIEQKVNLRLSMQKKIKHQKDLRRKAIARSKLQRKRTNSKTIAFQNSQKPTEEALRPFRRRQGYGGQVDHAQNQDDQEEYEKNFLAIQSQRRKRFNYRYHI